MHHQFEMKRFINILHAWSLSVQISQQNIYFKRPDFPHVCGCVHIIPLDTLFSLGETLLTPHATVHGRCFADLGSVPVSGLLGFSSYLYA